MLELRSSGNNGSRQANHLTSKEEEEEEEEEGTEKEKEEEEEEKDHCQRSPPCTVGVGIDR